MPLVAEDGRWRVQVAAGRGIIHVVPARLPKLPADTGEYAVEWFLDDRVIPGELSLEPSRPPRAGLFGDVVPKDWSQGGGFPEDHNLDRVVGRLRSGPDVVLTDARLSIWFMERSLGTRDTLENTNSCRSIPRILRALARRYGPVSRRLQAWARALPSTR